MFAALRRRRDDVAESKRIAATPFPSARVPLRLVEPPGQRSYEEVARSLGFNPAELTYAQLLAFFEEKDVEVYDYSQVSAWLTRKKVEAKAEHWCWRALREKDIIEGYRWGWNPEALRNDDGFYSSQDWSCRPYDRLVPLHALEKVAMIEVKFGDGVRFFVSDYAAPDVDPFIMVRPAMSNSGTQAGCCLVFDMWDEPGFGV